jgi:DNA polymerase III delta prime subunit
MKSAMENIIASQKIPNATLFFGPNLSAQNQAITHYAQQLHNMPNSITTEPSDTIQEPSIDIITINTGTTSIKIDMIKALQQRIKYGPSTHPYAIVIIYNISKLSQSAANALLKSIEEPPPHTIFLLSCQNKATVLPTIISRCQSLFIPYTPTQQLSHIPNTIDEINQEINYISPFEFLKLTELDKIHYIHQLPYKPQLIETLLNTWSILLFENMTKLTKKETLFFEKIIEIIANMKYNFNLKLQLIAITFDTEEVSIT